MQSPSSTKLHLTTKQLARLGLVLVVVVSVAFSGIQQFLLRDYTRAQNNEKVSTHIVTETFTRRSLANDYLLNPTARANEQWHVEQKAVLTAVQDYDTRAITPEEASLLAQIRDSVTQSSKVFEQVVQTSVDDTSSEVWLEQRPIFAAQLNEIGQTTLSAATKLKETNTQHAEQVTRHISLLGDLIGIAYLGMILLIFILISRSAGRLQLREAEEAAILGSIGDGVFAIDTDKRIILFNRTAEILTGFSFEEAFRQPYRDILAFIDEHSHRPIVGFIDHALAGQQHQMPANTLLSRKDGSVIPVADSAAPIVNDKGVVTGVVVVFRDITKEREVEQAKAEFVSLVSHQLRTPATAVKQFLGLIREGYTRNKKEEKEFIESAYTSNEEQLQIVDDILSVAKIDAGKLALNKEPTDIGLLAQRAVDQLHASAHAKGQSLTYHHPKHAVTTLADSLKLSMVVENLISNAIKYTPDGGKISVELEDDKNHITLRVTDNGIGIDADGMKQLFTKFGRVQTDYTAKVQGTGLGLYLAQQFIVLHGGKITVDSKPGNGTQFIVKLPKEQ